MPVHASSYMCMRILIYAHAFSYRPKHGQKESPQAGGERLERLGEGLGEAQLAQLPADDAEELFSW